MLGIIKAKTILIIISFHLLNQLSNYLLIKYKFYKKDRFSKNKEKNLILLYYWRNFH